MTNAKWDYTSAFTYDGNAKTVSVTGLPSGVTVKTYENNQKTNAGSYIAKVSFNYDSTNYNEPTLQDLDWKIVSDYTITTTLENSTADSSNETKISPNGSVTLIFNAVDGYSLPTKQIDITVTGADIDSWTPTVVNGRNTSATLIINNPKDNVTIEIKSGNLPTISLDSGFDATLISNTTIKVNANNYVSLEWYHSLNDIKSYKQIIGAYADTYETTISDMSYHFYKCRAINKYGYAESGDAKFLVD